MTKKLKVLLEDMQQIFFFFLPRGFFHRKREVQEFLRHIYAISVRCLFPALGGYNKKPHQTPVKRQQKATQAKI